MGRADDGQRYPSTAAALRWLVPRSELEQEPAVRQMAAAERLAEMVDRDWDRIPAGNRPQAALLRDEAKKLAMWVHKNQSTKPGNDLLKRYPSVRAAREQLGIQPYRKENGGWNKKLLRRLQEASWETGQLQTTARILDEAVVRARAGWFPVFATLDIAPEYYHLIYGKAHNRAVRAYIRRIRRQVAAEMGLTAREASRAREGATTFGTYIKIPEFGKKSGRFHYHVLMFLPEVPKRWQSDPNPRRDGSSQTIAAGAEDWAYGLHTEVLAVRLGPDDPWGRRLGWNWPLDADTLLAKRVGTAGAIGGYFGKYLNKESRQWRQTNKVAQRASMSRGFGNEMVEALLDDPGNLMDGLTGKLAHQLKQVNRQKTPSPSGRRLRYNALKRLRGTSVSTKDMVSAYRSHRRLNLSFLATWMKTREAECSHTNNILWKRLRASGFRGADFHELDRQITWAAREKAFSAADKGRGAGLAALLEWYQSPRKHGQYLGVSIER